MFNLQPWRSISSLGMYRSKWFRNTANISIITIKHLWLFLAILEQGKENKSNVRRRNVLSHLMVCPHRLQEWQPACQGVAWRDSGVRKMHRETELLFSSKTDRAVLCELALIALGFVFTLGGKTKHCKTESKLLWTALVSFCPC